ncbi:MAG TPA: Uma2 family endonuclease [Pirellulaceae bacterium]|nr:Uma2 family endonuclease [Pirellulaceae bacterium]
MSIAASPLLTADAFARMPDPGHPQELVRGAIIDMPPPKPRHGQVCVNVCFYLRSFVEAHRLGHVVANDTGVITGQDPDTVRGMDVAFISFTKFPPGPLPASYFTVAPDAVFEVRSPGDRRSEIYRKICEYHDIGVPAVYVLDPETSRVHCYFPDRPEEILNVTDQFAGIGPLADFSVPVAKFFE